MSNLTDTQTILLSSASQRDDGSLLPLPPTLGAGMNAVTKAIAALIKCGLAQEEPAANPARAWRTEDDVRFGAIITDAGRVAIGIEPEGGVVAADDGGGEEACADCAGTNVDRPTKAMLVLSLLQREQGATLAELVEATGWLPHTTRAALTGIRKKGHAVARGKRENVTCYTLAA